MSNSRLMNSAERNNKEAKTQRMLGICCKQRVPVTIFPVDSEEVYQARFENVMQDCFTLELFGELARPEATSNCLFLFTREDRTHAFVTAIRDCDYENLPPQLRAELPNEIATEGR